MEFFHVDLGNLLTISSFIAGGLIFIFTIRGDVRVTTVRLTAVEKELSELRKVVVEIARQEERMNAMDQRMLAQGGRLDQISKKLDEMVPYDLIVKGQRQLASKD